jgi:hypothetical protein
MFFLFHNQAISSEAKNRAELILPKKSLQQSSDFKRSKKPRGTDIAKKIPSKKRRAFIARRNEMHFFPQHPLLRSLLRILN